MSRKFHFKTLLAAGNRRPRHGLLRRPAGGGTAGQRFTVELALSRQEQTRGLMFRDELPRNTGMLFIFNNEAPRSFWMKNTRIPLDILYFDRSLRLVSMSGKCPTVQGGPLSALSQPETRTVRAGAQRRPRRGTGRGPGDQLALLFEL